MTLSTPPAFIYTLTLTARAPPPPSPPGKQSPHKTRRFRFHYTRCDPLPPVGVDPRLPAVPPRAPGVPPRAPGVSPRRPPGVPTRLPPLPPFGDLGVPPRTPISISCGCGITDSSCSARTGGPIDIFSSYSKAENIGLPLRSRRIITSMNPVIPTKTAMITRYPQTGKSLPSTTVVLPPPPPASIVGSLLFTASHDHPAIQRLVSPNAPL